MTALLHHLTSLDGPPVVGCMLLALVFLSAVCAVGAGHVRASEGSDYQQGERP